MKIKTYLQLVRIVVLSSYQHSISAVLKQKKLILKERLHQRLVTLHTSRDFFGKVLHVCSLEEGRN